MAYTGQNQTTTTDEQLGAFSGYIRRPTPNVSGMTAQIFGENGEDADTILALSLTKYQDAQVFVNIYLVKDPNGQIMKQGDAYPLISSFLGFVRRSMPKKEGMIAQFFAPNGEDADEIAKLSKSVYQDSLVFVDVRGSLAIKNADQIRQENIKEIEDKHHFEKVTKTEKIEINKKEKAFKKMNEQLEFGEFLYRVEVLTSLGSGEEFKEWLIEKQPCSHFQEKTCLNHSGALNVEGIFKPYNYLPCCAEHEPQLSNPNHFENNKNYYEMKHRLLTKQWAGEIMKSKFSFDGKSEPDPSKVIEWASSKNLSKYLPSKYQPV